MDLTPAPKTPAAVIDASLIIGLCAKEPDKHAAALAKLDQYDKDGRELFAPALVVGEVVHVLCRKLKDNSLDAIGHTDALRTLVALLGGIGIPKDGDVSLIMDAERIRGCRTCKQSSDVFYLALTERLSADRDAELATFDTGIEKQARASSLTVKVDTLPVGAP